MKIVSYSTLKTYHMKKLFLIFALFVGIVTISHAQIEDQKIEDSEIATKSIVIVYTKTGEIYRGYFISQNKDFLVIENETVGKITIPTDRIKKIESTDSNAKLKVDSEPEEVNNINSAKYFFGSSGFNFEKGGNYLTNNFMSYHRGVSENFSIGIGTSLVTLVAGLPIFYINPHYTYSFNENLHFKAGVDAFIGFAEGESGIAALLNTGLTIGTPDLNLTGTVYYGALSGIGLVNQPIFSVAGMARVSKKLALVSENLLVPNVDSGVFFLGSYGLRYLTDNGSFDFFFVNNRAIAEIFIIGFPGFGFTLKL